jgi:nucleoside-diphosphate-sugar epimerase
MKILAAGGAGYIGSVLIPKIIARGYDVTVVDLLWFGNHLPQDVSVIKKDIFDLTEKDLEGYDQVIFLAGLSNDPMAEFSPKDNFIQNASAPAYLGYIAKRAGVKRYIYAGSCSVYGYTVNELYDEESPAVSNYPYGISKLQGEYSALQMADKNFSVITFRQGTVSGYSPRMRLDLIVNTMFKSAIHNKEIIINNPSIWRPILSIQDAANAYIRAIEANYDINGIFNIASGNYTVGQVGDLVKDTLEKELHLNIKLTIKNIQDYRNYKVSFEKAAKVLSYKPMNDIENIVESLLENLEQFNDFDNPKYYNISVFKGLKETGGKL